MRLNRPVPGGFARTFFVDATGGSDDNDGRSIHEPWQTVGQVNSWLSGGYSLPRDYYLFKCGETFADAILRITCNGASGSPITFGAYGSGPKPIFSPTNTIPLYTNEVVRSYIHINDLDCAVNGTGNFAAQVELAHSLIDGCIFRDANIHGFLLGQDSDDVTIQNCEVKDNADSGFSLYHSVTSPINCIIQDNDVHDNGESDTLDHGIYARGGSGHVIRRNECYNNAGGGIKINSVASCQVYQNNGHDNDAGLVIGAESGLTCNGHLVYNNRLVSNTKHGILFLNEGLGCNDSEFYHNHIVINGDDLGGCTGVRFYYGGSSGNVFKNNIFYGDYNLATDGSWCLRFANATVRDAQTFDYNCYLRKDHPSSPDQIVYDGSERTFADWQGFGHDANGMEADPIFVTNYTDLHLQSTSPCRGAGVDVGVLVDYDGVARGDPPDVGALEYVA